MKSSVFNQSRDESRDEEFMAMAIELAREAAGDGETPVGCVITYRGQVIGSGRNRRNTLKDPLAHAEMEAIRQASGFLGDWRLEECTMYVSLEPCPMCAGAIVQSRIPTCVMGAMNPKAGCAGSILNIPETPGFNHHCFLKKGVLEEESRQVLQNFFSQLRNNI